MMRISNILRKSLYKSSPAKAILILAPANRLVAPVTPMVTPILLFTRGKASSRPRSGLDSLPNFEKGENKLYVEAGKFVLQKGIEWYNRNKEDTQDYGPRPSVTKPWKPVVQYLTFDNHTEMIAIYLPGLAPCNTILSYEDGIINVSGSRFLESWLTDSHVAYMGRVPVPEKYRKKKDIVYGMRMSNGVLKVVINDKIRIGGYKPRAADEPADEGKLNLDNFPGVPL